MRPNFLRYILLIVTIFRQERITTTKKGSITSVQAVYVPADDLTDPAPATIFAHLDATTVLSRSIAELGIYPAVDPLDSKSCMLDPRIVGKEHYEVATAIQKILQDYKSLQDITPSLLTQVDYSAPGSLKNACAARHDRLRRLRPTIADRITATITNYTVRSPLLLTTSI